MINSDRFSVKHLRNMIDSWTEGPRLDFKSMLYKLDSARSQFDFASDIIAFANVSRRIGKPCWIVFGVGDQPRQLSDTLIREYPGKKKPGVWDNPSASLLSKQSDGVEKVFREVARDWIEPEPEIELEFGFLDDHFLSYLEIFPIYPVDPFQLRKEIIFEKDGKERKYDKGSVFVRKTSSTCQVRKEDEKHLLTVCQASYLKKQEWKDLVIAHLSDDFLEAKYLPPNFHSYVKGSKDEIEQAVIDELDNGRKIITIVAPAGMGKTTILHRISYQLAHRHNIDLITRQDYYGGENEPSTMVSISELEFVNPIDLEMLPSFPIPIFFELRIAFDNIDQFNNSLLSRIRKHIGNKEIQTLESLFSIPGSRWIILLDGIDEIRNREASAPKLRTWVNELPANVQVVLTSRPGYGLSEQDGRYRFLEIDQLNPEEIRRLLKGKIGANRDAGGNAFPTEKTLDDLSSLTELSGFLFNHRAIDGLIELWLPKSVSVLKPVIDRVSENVIVHDSIPYKYDVEVNHSIEIGDMPFITHDEIISDLDIQADIIQQEDINSQNEGSDILTSSDDTLRDESQGNTESVIDESETDESETDESEIDEAETFSLPSLAGMTRYVVGYLYKKEEARREDWGKKEKHAVNTARNELAYIAWKENWEITDFNSFLCIRRKQIKSDSLACNEDIGFLESLDGKRHRFISSLLHKYFIADFGFDLENNEIVRGIKRHDLQSESTKMVLNMLDQLFSDQGRPTLSSRIGV